MIDHLSANALNYCTSSRLSTDETHYKLLAQQAALLGEPFPAYLHERKHSAGMPSAQRLIKHLPFYKPEKAKLPVEGLVYLKSSITDMLASDDYGTIPDLSSEDERYGLLPRDWYCLILAYSARTSHTGVNCRRHLSYLLPHDTALRALKAGFVELDYNKACGNSILTLVTTYAFSRMLTKFLYEYAENIWPIHGYAKLQYQHIIAQPPFYRTQANWTPNWLHDAAIIALNLFYREETITEQTIVWKKVRYKHIVELLLEPGTRVCCMNNRLGKSRADHAKVLNVYSLEEGSYIQTTMPGESMHRDDFYYKAGETVRPELAFASHEAGECSSGIHFFFTKQEAIDYCY